MSYGSPSGVKISPLPEETITIEEWLAETSITAGTRRNRKVFLRTWTQANGKNPTDDRQAVEAAKELLKDIAERKTTVYHTSKKLTDAMRQKGCKPTTVAHYRSMLPGLFESTLGEESIKRSVFDRLVRRGDYYVTKTKKAPSPDELRRMLELAQPRNRALLGLMACTGCRISEAVSRRMTDLEFNKDKGRVRIKFQAGETKARTRRYAFLSKEVDKWIMQFRLDVGAQAKEDHAEPSQWLFPGELGNHLSAKGAYHKLKRLFAMAGCKDTEDETYSPHSMRTFADKEMSKAGLDRKYIALIVGHKSQLASESHYVDWAAVEDSWFERCEDKMTWFKPVEVIKEVADPKARSLLSKLIKALGEAETFDDVGDISGLLEEGEKLLEDKSKEVGG